MGEISKAVGQWIAGNVGWTVIIILFVVSSGYGIYILKSIKNGDELWKK